MKINVSYRVILDVALLVFCSVNALQAQSVSSKSEPDQAANLVNDVRVKWLKKNAVNVRSIDPKDEDFRDLAPLKKAIGNSRIVMLGESGHGDGGTFLGRTRLIKFLHQQMGFDVLVFEGGLYDMSKVWESVRRGDISRTALRQGMFPPWSNSDQVIPLMDYLAANARTKRPLELAGFDSQTSGSASGKQLINELQPFLNELGIKTDLLAEGTSFRTALENVILIQFQGKPQIPSPVEQEKYLFQLDQLEKDITAKSSANKDNLRINFWRQVLRSLHTYSKQSWSFWQSKDKAPPIWDLGNARDKQGAENMLWLANERYKGRKIIVWAATWHLIRQKGLPDIKDSDYDDKDHITDFYNSIQMGYHLWNSLGKQIYVIGFTTYGGNAGIIRDGKGDKWTGPLKQDQHPSVEMEELFNAAGFNYAFLDLRSPRKDSNWLKTPIKSRPMGNTAALRDWT